MVREIVWLIPVLAIVGIAISWHIISIKPRLINADKLEAHHRIMGSYGNQ